MRIIGHIMRQSNSQIQNKLNSGITMSITEIILSRKKLKHVTSKQSNCQ